MNNLTTGLATQRNCEHVDILTLQILGLIAREGNGQFFLTEKFERLRLAIERKERGYMLLQDDEVLIEECQLLIPRH